MDLIRISGAGLVRFDLDQRILLSLNWEHAIQGNSVYTPPGGGLKAEVEGRAYLNGLGATQWEDEDTLRFCLPSGNFDYFETWFRKQTQREITPFRELMEEFVYEGDISATLEEVDVSLDYQKTIKPLPYLSDRTEQSVLTQRIFEIYGGQFSSDYQLKIERKLAEEVPTLVLVTANEIRNQRTKSGLAIGKSSLALLD